MARLRGAAVLITGASSGIGEATALAFARRRTRLALCARRAEPLRSVALRCRRAGAADVLVRTADVGRPEEVRAFVLAALTAFERIDVLVNNAGVGWHGRFETMPQATLTEIVATNVLGAMWATQAALPAMLEARSGVIVNVASVVGVRAMPYSAVYSASKHALVGFSHALRGELSGTGVKVCTVHPGTTNTGFFGGRDPEGLIAQSPQWVARTIVRAARWPRRDVYVLPYRIAQVAEPLLGGLLDHLLGEFQRSRHPGLRRSDQGRSGTGRSGAR
ncbi:MAG TPA: SDR family NAD(P)-dependent oxidoreductase [Candidatus Dormibacteraeota bacterium]|jgi:short-subunit dehydrogenase|nr:SDR family NAD(P)-dependent oxidoreductase [Candidatus Dormibacteraeota bacterium]